MPNPPKSEQVSPFKNQTPCTRHTGVAKRTHFTTFGTHSFTASSATFPPPFLPKRTHFRFQASGPTTAFSFQVSAFRFQVSGFSFSAFPLSAFQGAALAKEGHASNIFNF
jgi:hypothetical protein